MAVPTLVFEDDHGELSPLTDLRPSFLVRTGALTLLERLGLNARLTLTGWSAPRLPTLTAELLAQRSVNLHDIARRPAAGSALCINGRCTVPPEAAFSLREHEALIEEESGHVIAVHTAVSRLKDIASGDRAGLRIVASPHRCLLTKPWDVRRFRDACLGHDLTLLTRSSEPSLPANVWSTGDHPLHIAPTARLGPMVALDRTQGPIAIDAHAVIRPGAVLAGPCFVGAHSTVLEHATIRPGTAIGPWCKAGGEVGGTIFQGYANKAHDGYVGDSYIGEWVNLGAGTITSNLLNTYGEVIARARPSGPNERTGEQFLGSVIGDHAKTAIGTKLMAGTIVGTGAMLASSAFVSGCVPAFAWLTDEQEKTYRRDKFLEVMRAVMGRRNIAPGTAYVEQVAGLLK